MLNEMKRNFEITVNKIAKAKVITELRNKEKNNQVIMLDQFNELVQKEVRIVYENTIKIVSLVFLLVGISLIFM